MGSLIFGTLIVLAAIVLFIVRIPDFPTKMKNIAASVAVMVGVVIGAFGAVGYNDAGYCQHVRTVFGTEDSACNTGWYFLGWGTSTEWPQFITVANSTDSNSDGSSVTGPYPVRLADNWNGEVTQTTRFGIPQDKEQFLKMARDFRSPERLITTTLRPAVTSSLDSVANLFSMEEYYAGGKRDEFKTEFRDAVMKGRAKVHQVSSTVYDSLDQGGQAPNDQAAAQDTANVGDVAIKRTVMEKVLVDGHEVREPQGYMNYGIIVSSAILENLDPDDRFEEQIQARKDAASRRIVAQEQRKEQEEQRLLAIQTGETEIAKRQAAARVEQIEKTTNAETEKKLALITADRQRQQAEVDRQTAAIRLKKAEIDAQAQQVLADAAAYEKRVVLEADGALSQKLDAWVSAQKVWADAAAQINVPTTVFASGGNGSEGSALNTIEGFMNIMMMNAAKDLQVNPTITK